MSAKSAVTVEAILGCWRLERAIEERDGVPRPNPRYGERPNGFLHYLAGNRVAVTIPLGDRPQLSGNDRADAPIAELAQAARTFDAYAGRFSLIAPDRIVHHVEVATYQNHVGTDLRRGIDLAGDLLRLHVPPTVKDGVTISRWLEWRRLPTERERKDDEE